MFKMCALVREDILCPHGNISIGLSACEDPVSHAPRPILLFLQFWYQTHACIRNHVSLMPGHNYFSTSIPVLCALISLFKNLKARPPQKKNHLGDLMRFEETQIIVNYL